MNRTTTAVIGWALIVVGVITAAVVCIRRAAVERSYREVAIVVPWEDIELLHAAREQPYAELLEALAQAGVTAVGVLEDTPVSLAAEGRVEIEGGETGTTFIAEEPGLAERMGLFLKAKMPDRVRVRGTRVRVEGVVFDERLGDAGVGLTPWVCRRVKAAGLGLFARPKNDPLSNSQSLAVLLAQLSSLGAWAMLPEGSEVLGFDRLTEAVAEALRQGGIFPCSVEFAKQHGDTRLGQAVGGAVLKVHSITPAEMPKYSAVSARERFLRAVRERNVRVCYVRVLSRPSQEFVSRNMEYLASVKAALEGARYQPGLPTPLGGAGVGPTAVLLMGLGVWGALVVLAVMSGTLRGRAALIVGGTGLLASAALLAGAPLLARKVLALGAAVLFPTLAIVQVVQGEALLRRRAGAALGLLAATTLSVCGGLVIGALLFDREFLNTVRVFSGVKLSLMTPVLLVFAWLLSREALLTPGERWREVGHEWRLFAEQPLRIKHMLAGLAVALLAVVWILRSGNAPDAPQLPLEAQFRGVLEQVFGARPRTKEVLFGHPLLLAGLWLWARGARGSDSPNALGPAKALVLLGSIGQVSVVNSFCHLHSPLGLTLLRVIQGLWLGALVGAVLVVAIQLLSVRPRPSVGAGPP